MNFIFRYNAVCFIGKVKDFRLLLNNLPKEGYVLELIQSHLH